MEERIQKLLERSRDRTSKLLEVKTKNLAKENSPIRTYTRRQLSVAPSINPQRPLYQSTPFLNSRYSLAFQNSVSRRRGTSTRRFSSSKSNRDP